MKMHRAMLTSLALPVVAAGLAWWGGTPASAAEAWNTASVSISGTVSGRPESVSFSGNALIGSRVAPDPDFNSPRFVVDIDLTGVSGVGSSTQTKYVIPARQVVQKRVAASHLVEVSFPFTPSGSTDPTSARSGVASFSLSFDTTTGAVTAAKAAISTPSY